MEFAFPEFIIEKMEKIAAGQTSLTVLINREDIENIGHLVTTLPVSLVNESPLDKSGPFLKDFEFSEDSAILYEHFSYLPNKCYWVDDASSLTPSQTRLSGPNSNPVDPIITYKYSSDNTIYLSGVLAPGGWHQGSLSPHLVI